MKNLTIRITILLLLLLSSTVMIAQCAMCKVNAENASRENISVGEELNDGIIYLMLMPYILLATVVMVFYRKKIITFIRS